jgi:hypothetical protein
MLIIVTTTINPPTKATLKFAKLAKENNWNFIIVGDLKTPHDLYRQLEVDFNGHVTYLHPDEQNKLYPELSTVIGWKTIQRRNIGFVYAYNNGAEIIATVDDDNIPYDNWGKNIYIGQEIECDRYTTDNLVFDPLAVTNHDYLWHRGVPIELLQLKNNVTYTGKTKRKVLIQADLWDGDPDIDAMARLTYKPLVKFNITQPYCSDVISPFNSQNTFIAREIIPYYTVLPYVGRMDDIWSSYYIQTLFKDNLIYAPASVYQDRNVQDLITNLEKEVIGYRNTLNFILSNCDYNCSFIPEETRQFFKTYRACFSDQL